METIIRSIHVAKILAQSGGRPQEKKERLPPHGRPGRWKALSGLQRGGAGLSPRSRMISRAQAMIWSVPA
jgi:hypothetical protein